MYFAYIDYNFLYLKKTFAALMNLIGTIYN
jgi:hypothetical protein